jgi:hypothetical protein
VTPARSDDRADRVTETRDRIGGTLVFGLALSDDPERGEPARPQASRSCSSIAPIASANRSR